jgi:acyl-CoA synthetase (AMP-forming)/AMP-acid ligase II
MTVSQISPGRCRTAVEALRRAAELDPDVEAYVEPAATGASGRPRRALSFSALDRAADGVAGLLADQGVGRGDVVCLILPSSIDYAVCYAAAMRLGAITSGVNPRLGRDERESIVERLRPSVTVVDPGLDLDVPPGAGAVLTREEVAESWSGPAPGRLRDVAEDQPVAVVWTSGTTGHPKGAVFDHRCLAAVCDGADVLSHRGDRRLSPLPFAHVGYMTKVWDEYAHAITTVITPAPWRADQALAILERERVTVAQGVPTQWALLLELDHLDRADLSSLRIAGTGAAPMPAAQVREIRRRVGVPVVVRYASTEAAICTGTVPDDPDEVVATTVGRPVPGVELSVVDEGGVPVPAGTPGRVRVRSAAVMRGYWSGEREPGDTAVAIDHAATATVLSPDGWVTTGDHGVVDAAGNLRLVGREGERYIRGGYNVFPAEVEEVLVAHPSVARAAVVGAEDPVLGEVGVAFVVPSTAAAGGVPDLAELRAHCAAHLADYKSPDVLVVVDQLPLTPMMKVDKRALSDPARREAGLRSVRRGRSDTSSDEPATPGKEGR